MLTLLYHNVLKTSGYGLPVAAHQVTINTLRHHVNRLRSQLLHPLDVHEQLTAGRMPRGVLITFDDGGAGIEYAAEILAEAGTAGVAFICPGVLDRGLWFYRLADAIVRSRAATLRWNGLDLPLKEPFHKRNVYSVLSKELFDQPALTRDANIDKIELAIKTPKGEPHSALTTLDEAGLQRTARTGGMIFANHSWSHPNLVKLDSEELSFEIKAAHEYLASSGLPFLPWFAFPRGFYDTRVKESLDGLYPIAFGALAREPDPQVLPRTYIREADSNQVRLVAKTAMEGRLRRYLYWK